MKIATKENSICYFFSYKETPLYLVLELPLPGNSDLRRYAIAGHMGVSYGFIIETPDSITLANVDSESKITLFKDVDTLTTKDGHVGRVIDFEEFNNEFQKICRALDENQEAET